MRKKENRGNIAKAREKYVKVHRLFGDTLKYIFIGLIVEYWSYYREKGARK